MTGVKMLGLLVMSAALLMTGCATSTTQDIKVSQTTVYSSMESTALVYTDPESTSPVDDNPIRWVAFLVSPFANGLDYLVNRPLYSLASMRPGLFGYTSEDAMLHSQRPQGY